jgi:hypothetical protein
MYIITFIGPCDVYCLYIRLVSCLILNVVVIDITGDDLCYDQNLFSTATLFLVPTCVKVRAETLEL